MCQDLDARLLRKNAKPRDMEHSEWERLDRKITGFIRQWLDDNVFHLVSMETSAESLWKKLESLYERKTASNKAFLI